MTDHRARAGVDCPRCGQRYVDLDLHQFIDDGNTPTDFADMVWRLQRAHADTCKPARSKPAPADRRRRTRWWLYRTAIPAVAALTILALSSAGRPPWASLTLGALLGWLAVAPGPQDALHAYRRGYWRDRLTAHHGPVPEKDLHPADRAWLEEHP